jgi:hypothetical protein
LIGQDKNFAQGYWLELEAAVLIASGEENAIAGLQPDARARDGLMSNAIGHVAFDGSCLGSGWRRRLGE